MLAVVSLLALPLGLLIGAVPFADLVARRRGVRITEEGSGNVGALNTFRTTGSWQSGALVLLLDALKGAAATALGAGIALASEPPLGWWLGGALGVAGAVAGHVYNPILSWRRRELVGGKGLATATGGLLILLPWTVLVWGTLFAAVHAGARALGHTARAVDAGNLAATALLPPGAWALYALVHPSIATAAAFTTGCLGALVLPKLTRAWSQKRPPAGAAAPAPEGSALTMGGAQ